MKIEKIIICQEEKSDFDLDLVRGGIGTATSNKGLCEVGNITLDCLLNGKKDDTPPFTII